jgi:hypothetical protein
MCVYVCLCALVVRGVRERGPASCPLQTALGIPRWRRRRGEGTDQNKMKKMRHRRPVCARQMRRRQVLGSNVECA